MLEKVRKPARAKKFVAYIIFGAICLSFVFVGLDPLGGGISGSGAAATVNGEIISIADFTEQVQRAEKQYQSRLENFSAAQRQKLLTQIRVQALDDLIRSEVTAQGAEQSGVLATSQQIQRYIVDIPAFQTNNGSFDRERYNNYLKYRRTSAGVFEREIKKQIITTKLRDLFSKAMVPSRIELNLQQKLRETQFSLRFVAVDSSTFKVKASAEQAKDYLAKNEQAVQEYYDSHKTEFTRAEAVKARHILIKVKAGDKKSEEAALKKITKIRSEATPENFAELAQKHSEDISTRPKGGDLGFFTRGKMLPDFEKVAFDLSAQKISGPVKTHFGYHIIKAEGRREKEVKKLTDVSMEVAKKLLSKELSSKKVDTLKELVKTGKKKLLEATFKKHKLKWLETGEFNLQQVSIPKIGDLEELYIDILQVKGPQLMSKVYFHRGQNYIVELTQIKTTTKTLVEDNMSSTALASQTTFSTFTSWVESNTEQAKIKKNGQLILNN